MGGVGKLEFSIGISSPFSLDYTLESGQAFRWENRGEWWYGVVGGGVIKARQEGETLRLESSSERIDSGYVRSYFRTEENLSTILASIDRDPTINGALQRYYGLRLIRQDFFECLASFVLATNVNIPRIRKMIDSLCSKFGTPIQFEGLQYFSFPEPQTIADSTTLELRACGLGYRAPFLKKVAESIVHGEIDRSELSLKTYDEAQGLLLKRLSGMKVLPGVGPKVADCVLLFSCDQDEAFPIDIWIARALSTSYPAIFGRGNARKLSLAAYRGVSAAARGYFGSYAGYAQQYLYMSAREKSMESQGLTT